VSEAELLNILSGSIFKEYSMFNSKFRYAKLG